MKNVQAPFDQAVIMICEKCGKKLIENTDKENPSKSIHQALKKKILDSGNKGKLRALVTTCLDICPEGKIAAGVISLESSHAQFVEFAPDKEIDSDVSELFSKATGEL